jgi:putative toxin-antitoxin system antitoxin component (TIGR02293 family)
MASRKDSQASQQAKLAIQQPPDHSIAQLRETDIKNNAKMADLVAHGIALSSVWELGQRLAISQKRLGELLSIPKRTLHRRVQKQELLKPDESERVLRLFRLYFRAMEVFEDGDRALKWFASHPKALGGRTPLEFARTEPGARLVEDLLGRIEEGVFS